MLTYLGFSSICLWLKMMCVTILSTGIPIQCTYLSTYLGCSSICLPMQRTYHNIPRQQQQRLFMVDDDVCHTLEFRNYDVYLCNVPIYLHLEIRICIRGCGRNIECLPRPICFRKRCQQRDFEMAKDHFF